MLILHRKSSVTQKLYTASFACSYIVVCYIVVFYIVCYIVMYYIAMRYIVVCYIVAVIDCADSSVIYIGFCLTDETRCLKISTRFI